MDYEKIENLSEIQVLDLYNEIIESEDSYDLAWGADCYGLCQCQNGVNGYSRWTWYNTSKDYVLNLVGIQIDLTGIYFDICSSTLLSTPCRGRTANWVYLYECRKVD